MLCILPYLLSIPVPDHKPLIPQRLIPSEIPKHSLVKIAGDNPAVPQHHAVLDSIPKTCDGQDLAMAGQEHRILVRYPIFIHHGPGAQQKDVIPNGLYEMEIHFPHTEFQNLLPQKASILPVNKQAQRAVLRVGLGIHEHALDAFRHPG